MDKTRVNGTQPFRHKTQNHSLRTCAYNGHSLQLFCNSVQWNLHARTEMPCYSVTVLVCSSVCYRAITVLYLLLCLLSPGTPS